MDIPNYVILLVFAIGVLVFFVLSIFDVYHLVRYEAFTTKAKIYLTIYSFVFIGIIVAALLLTAHVDWGDTFNFISNGSTQY